MAIAKVEPLTTARALRGPFDYRLPERLAAVGVGSVLLVPFGRRRLLGVVVEVAESSELPPDRLAEPVHALEAGATPELVRLGLWVAREYCSTPARGLELVLPPGMGRDGRGPVARMELLVAATAAGSAALDGGTHLGRRQRDALAALVGQEGAPRVEVSASELEAAARVDRQTLRRLEARGLVTMRARRSNRRPEVVGVGAPSTAPRLSGEQRVALERIRAAIEGSSERELLLWGVTGSGKTEVYIAAAEAALRRGRGSIVMVPEIALTPQITARFTARFGDRVALLHSRLRRGERLDEWERLRTGEARICVGPRSAVFAPIDDLGLVVIDEEHDASYKQEGDPRYDAREVARHRAAKSGAALVAGTATPRPESWLGLDRVELPTRADGRSLPQVELVDLRGRSARAGPLHPRTAEALADVAAQRAKAIVLLNRRGWTPFLDCRSCGRAWSCPRCDVSLVIHRLRDGGPGGGPGEGWELRCHHCGHAERAPDCCPECGSVALARHGAGTQRLAELLSRAAAPLPVFRLDSDAAAGAGGHIEILRRFDEADSGVLVGTQMVAKGHDFPDVVLSVVLDADATLRFPDFRAEERTFALVAQLAGRSGRGERGGTVLVQTLAPNAPAIRHAAEHDAGGFLAGELERRRELRYPPFSHLVRIELGAADPDSAQRAAQRLARALEETVPSRTELLGPAPRFRLRGRHRRQLLLKSIERGGTVAAVRAAVEALAAARELRGVAVGVDVDPQ